MSKVVKVSDGAYQRIAEEASLQGIFLIDALDSLLFNEYRLIAGEEEDGDSAVRDQVDLDKFDVDQQQGGADNALCARIRSLPDVRRGRWLVGTLGPSESSGIYAQARELSSLSRMP